MGFLDFADAVYSIRFYILSDREIFFSVRYLCKDSWCNIDIHMYIYYTASIQ